MVNGQHLHDFNAVDDNEITALMFVESRKIVLSTGWSRQIVAYTYDSENVIF